MFGGDSPTEEVVAVGTQNSFAADLAVKLHVAAAAGTSGQGTAGECYFLSYLSHICVLFFCGNTFQNTMRLVLHVKFYSFPELQLFCFFCMVLVFQITFVSVFSFVLQSSWPCGCIHFISLSRSRSLTQ